MAIQLENMLRGQMAAAIFEVLLADAGYQVIPTGIEKTIRELRPVDHPKYRELVHQKLRSLPDLFVLDCENGQSWLVEIKSYRHLYHDKLIAKLERQKIWCPFFLILAVAEPPDEGTGPVDHIRVF